MKPTHLRETVHKGYRNSKLSNVTYLIMYSIKKELAKQYTVYNTYVLCFISVFQIGPFYG